MDLKDILARVRSCQICRDNPAGAMLPHDPRPIIQASGGARVLIAGQAPGTRAHASGRPFTDPSGDRLRQWLGVSSDIFYDERIFAIVPMGFCFPGLDRTGADLPPRRECAPAWRSSVLAGLPHVELVICLGQHAMRWHMGETFEGSVGSAVKNWRAGLDRRPQVIPLPHPSWRNSGWLKRNPWFEVELLPVLKVEVARHVA
jgi:uracil-DNA glycosylase